MYIKKLLCWHMQRVLPIVYDDSLSFQELLYKIEHKINEIINVTNDISNMIEKILQEWLDDGTIEDIIAAAMGITQKDLTINKYGRLLVNRLKFNTLSIMGNQSCVFYGNRYYTAGQIGSSGYCYLSSFENDGRLIAQNQLNIGHGNGIDANYDHLFVAGDNGVFNVLDLNLQFVQTIDATDYLQTSAGVGSGNGLVYFYGRSADDYNTMRIISCDSNYNLKPVCEFAHPANTVIQGFCIYKNKGYALFSRANQIYEINLDTGKITYIYNVPDGDGLYPTGELEDLFVMNGDIYIWTALYYPNRYGTGFSDISSGENIGLIFKTDILNQLQNDNRRDYLDIEQNLNIIYNGNADTVFNPYLTVNTATEAAMIINYHKFGSILLSNITEGSVFCLTGCRASLIGRTGDLIIKVLQAVQCDLDVHNVDIENVYINRGSLKWNQNSTDAILERAEFVNMQGDFTGINFSEAVSINNSASQFNIMGVVGSCPEVAADPADNVIKSSGKGRSLYLYANIKDKLRINTLLSLAPGSCTMDLNLYTRTLSVNLVTANTNGVNWYRDVIDPAGIYDKVGVDAEGYISLHRITEDDYIRAQTNRDLCYVTLRGYTLT